MSHFFGKGASNLQRGLPGVGALYTGDAGLVNLNTGVMNMNPVVSSTEMSQHPMIGQFMTRFGLQRVVARNDNIIDTLSNPKQTVININFEYRTLAKRCAVLYYRFYQELIGQGVPQGLAQKRADEYILPIMEGELQVMSLKYPYNFGSSSGESNLAMQNILFSNPGSSGQSLSELNDVNNAIGSSLIHANMKKKKKNKNL